jgi:hypothetical protein
MMNKLKRLCKTVTIWSILILMAIWIDFINIYCPLIYDKIKQIGGRK